MIIDKFLENESEIKRHIYFKTDGNATLTDDLFQDLYLKVYRISQDGAYKEEGKFLSWIKRVATNLVMDYYRKGVRKKLVLMEDMKVNSDGTPKENYGINNDVWDIQRFKNMEDEEYQDSFVTEEMREELVRCLDLLPEKQREIIIHRYFRNMTYNEIVLETGDKLCNLLPRHHYTIKRLRKEFNHDE